MNIRKLLITVMLFAATCCAGAQTITQLEYWVNDRFADKVTVPWGGGDVFALPLTIDDVPGGLYQLHFRVKDSEDRYSAVSSAFFLKLNHLSAPGATELEYWINNRIDKKYTVPISGCNILHQLVLPVGDLPVGFYQLNYRVKISEHCYTAVCTDYFLKINNGLENGEMVCEYWFDDDMGQRETFPVWGVNNWIAVDLDAKALSLGIHSITFRIGCTGGFFSFSSKHFFVKGINPYAPEQLLNKYIYWFDDDLANAEQADITPAVRTFELNTDIATTALLPGRHTFNIKFKDNYEQFTKLSTDFFIKPHIFVEDYICEGSVYEFNGKPLTEAGEYLEIFEDVNGMDSIVHLTLTVEPLINALPPTISASPEDIDIVTAGITTTTLSVTAASLDGGALTYQWYVNSTNSTAGATLITSATNATYNAPTTVNGIKYYFVIVTNTITAEGSCGNRAISATSDIAKVTVDVKIHAQIPNIITQPVGGTFTVAPAGTTTPITVVANVTDGGTLSYQWYRNTVNSPVGGTAIGTNSATLQVPIDDEGIFYYYVVITNTIPDNGDGGNKIAFISSNVATVTVNLVENAQTPGITTEPVGAVYELNDTAVPLTVAANVTDGGTLSYQWYRNTTATTAGATAVGANSVSFTPPTTAVSEYYYYVVITNTIPDNGDGGNKTATATSSFAKVSVIVKVNAQTPLITTHPASATVPQGTTHTLTVVANVTDGGTLSYQWYRNTINSNTGGIAVGTNSASYPAPINAIGTAYYYVVVTNTIPDNGDGGNKTANTTSNVATLTVIPVAVTGVILDITTHTMESCMKRQLTATVLPVNATNKNVTWSSNNNAVATVNANGLVSGVSDGTAVITVTTVDGGHFAKCTFTILVCSAYVTSVEITNCPDEGVLPVGTKHQLGVIVEPDDAPNKEVIWRSSDPNVAMISTTGKVTALMVGFTTITATSVDGGITDKCIIRVINPVEGVILNKAATTLTIGTVETLIATVIPFEASIKTVTWESSNEAVATVDASGKVKGIATGTAVITVTTDEGGFTATCTVTVVTSYLNPTAITVTPKILSIDRGETFLLESEVKPLGANPAVTWSSSAPAIVTVATDGTITAIAAGKATITAKTVNNLSATCTVTVTIPIDYIEVTPDACAIPLKGSKALKATVYPADASNKTIVWSSSDPTIATVSSTGTVTAKSINGEVEIYATNTASGKVGICVVTVGSGKSAPGIASDDHLDITIYPNPTNGMVTITGIQSATNIEIFDMTGRTVTVETWRAASLQPETNEPTLDLSTLPTGTYFIRINTDYGMVTKKIVKQ